MNIRQEFRSVPLRCFPLLALVLALTSPAHAEVVPNRAVPKVDLPQTGLHSTSSTPSTAEISRARVFEEPLVPISGEPTPVENGALAAALLRYSERTSPDDFASLTDFLTQYPKSAWRVALLTDLGIEYYNTAHYSLALKAWEEAWPLAKAATDAKGRALADRAAGELAYMYARVGRMTELEGLLQSVENRVFIGGATEKIVGAREGLWNMQQRPEISFRCGPLALQRIKQTMNAPGPGDMEIVNSASTQQGFPLPQVAELSKQVGLNYQMAFRENSGDFVVPSVVHWKVGHYAALVRQEGDRYLLDDPTFGNTVWASHEALEAETSGYFLLPPGPMPKGWRSVEAKEGAEVWGKGVTSTSDPGPHGPGDRKTGGGSCQGMTIPGVHLMLVNLNLSDEPVGYSPPVGPAVRFTVRYNHRDAFQPANFTYSNFGSKWTCDWISYIMDNPQSASADVNYYIMGGGTRTFTGFNAGTQTYAYQQYDQTRLTRNAPNPISYQMLQSDGSKLIFSQSNGSTGTSRKIFLTQIVDPFGNAVTLAYDNNLRLTNITDAIGQATTLTYGLTNDIYKITRVTDPFGRFAGFDYDSLGRLTNITDVIGLTSVFNYETNSDFINTLVTPYGPTAFTRGGSGTARWLETLYPDGSRDRVEFNQSTNGIAFSDPPNQVPQGMTTFNQWLHGRNTYYWSRNACAQGYGDYTKAKLYHWLHTSDITTTSGILESTKEALEGRVWYSYAGQITPYNSVGSNNRPTRVGRVLDDGATQLYTYAYDGFGHLTNSIDPLGRELSYLYSTNGIDLLEVRQTRGANNELLSRMTYNAQHLPLTITDAAGQTTTNTYNARGQILTTSNPKGETTSYTYDTNSYLIMVDGPLPGTNDSQTATYDSLGRTRTKTDENGYVVMFDYDALNRLTKITFPDGTFSQHTYNRLDPVVVTDRAGRQTLMDYDGLRQLTRRTDPLGRVTRFQWCSCGDLSSLTDPMGRTTTWNKDVQGRLTSKQYGDGSLVKYFYENTTSRLRQIVDEKLQVSQFTYNRDGTLNSVAYANSMIPTPSVSYKYDPNYPRPISMTDGIGTTLYAYNPIGLSPSVGAGRLASIDGPLSSDTITYGYDELGDRVSTAINGTGSIAMQDAAGRLVIETNALGAFTNYYDGVSGRLVLQTFPNSQTIERSYGDNVADRSLQRITHKLNSALISEFLYGRDIATGRIMTWSQQTGGQEPSLYAFNYDDADQLLSAAVTNSDALVNAFTYGYDLAGNRLTETAGATTNTASYNALNQLSTASGPGISRTNEWDAMNRLVAVSAENDRTELAYDGQGRLASVRLLTNGVQNSLRRFVWNDNELREERDASGTVSRRYFEQGMTIETGADAGRYFYTRDHLGSVREVTNANGDIRSRYTYDIYGRRIRVQGNLDADFGFAGLFWCAEAGLALARFRAYDPEQGRWLSRDPLPNAEIAEGPNLYIYVADNPVNRVDPLGLCCESEESDLRNLHKLNKCRTYIRRADYRCLVDSATDDDSKYFGGTTAWEVITDMFIPASIPKCMRLHQEARDKCLKATQEILAATDALLRCQARPCGQSCPPLLNLLPGMIMAPATWTT